MAKGRDKIKEKKTPPKAKQSKAPNSAPAPAARSSTQPTKVGFAPPVKG